MPVASSNTGKSGTFLSEFERKRNALIERFFGLRAKTSTVALNSRFSLADQVVVHALITAGLRVRLEDAGKRSKHRVRDITIERYGLRQLVKPGSDAVRANTFLKGWSDAELVQYVLDHEVPVDPADMPGFAKQVA